MEEDRKGRILGGVGERPRKTDSEQKKVAGQRAVGIANTTERTGIMFDIKLPLPDHTIEAV